MHNKLRNMFSDNMPEVFSKLQFENSKNRAEFQKAMESVYNEGRVAEINGGVKLNIYIGDGEAMYPHIINQHVEKLTIHPNITKIPITVNTVYGEKTICFKANKTSMGVHLETESDAIVFVEVNFLEENGTVNFKIKIQHEYANSMKDLAKSLYATISILKQWFESDNELDRDDSLKDWVKIKKIFQLSYSFFYKLSAIEEVLQLSFNPKQLDSTENNMLEVEELYLFLIKKIPVRLNAKLTASESTKFTLKNSIKNLEIGSNLDIAFVNATEYMIFDQKISIYTANLLTNAIVKEIVSEEKGTITVLYGDTDSRPMYISCTGFLTEKEAKAEIDEIVGRKEEYEKALTIDRYFKYDPELDCLCFGGEADWEEI